MRQPQKLDWLVGSGLALMSLTLYISTLAPTVLEADSGEFQFVPWLPGIAHPTGYPLYILLGWLWTHIFRFGEVAWRMNLLSAVFAAATVGLTYALARQMVDIALPNAPLSGRVMAALLAAVTFAVSRTFWSQAVVAEVYSLHVLFMALLLWLALKLRSTGGHLQLWPAKLLALTFGLGLTHHRTIILLLPALVLFLVLLAHQNKKPPTLPLDNDVFLGGVSNFSKADVSTGGAAKARQLIAHGVLLVAPLSLYLYLPLIAPATPYTSLVLSKSQALTLYENSARGFWGYVMGTVFTGELQPAAAGFDRLHLTWQLLRQQVGWGGAVLSLVGVFTLWQRKQVDLLLLTVLGSLAFAVFNWIYFIGDVFVLFIPVWLFVCLWIGVGTLGLAHWISTSFIRRKVSPYETEFFGGLGRCLERGIYRLLLASLIAATLLSFLVWQMARGIEVNQKNNTRARERWLEILTEPIPKDAVLLSNDRNEMMPMWYYQYVERRRPDLLGLFPQIVADPAYANVGRVLDQALISGRPVYLIKPMDGLSLKADFAPVGSLYRATTNNTPPTYRHELVLPEITIRTTGDAIRHERIKLLGYDLAPAGARRGDEVAITLHWQAVQKLSVDYTSYVHLVDGEGRGVTQSDHIPGGDFYPSSYWQVGEILRDHHTITLPADAPSGVYRLRVGLYYQPEPGLIEAMGNGEEIGLLIVK